MSRFLSNVVINIKFEHYFPVSCPVYSNCCAIAKVDAINYWAIMEILQKNPDTRKCVLSALGRNEESFGDDVKIVREWILQQPHLPEIMDDKMIERILLINKCSIERTKANIDMYYTIRTLLPDFYTDTNPRLPHMQEISMAIYCIPLPKMTKDHERLVIIKVNEEMDISEHINPYHYFASTFHSIEIRLHEDFMLSSILVYDCKGATIKYMSKLNPIVLKKASIVMDKVISNRISAIHLFNVPNIVEPILQLAKTLVKPKLAQRFHIHKNQDNLLDIFPREILPVDYGGSEKSLKELQNLWAKKLGDYRERFDKLDNLRVDEEKRPEKLENDDILGFYGNFKALNVD